MITNDISQLTELDARVLLANLVALVVGEEHVGGQTALRHVGVYRRVSRRKDASKGWRDRLTLLSLAAGGLVGALAGSLAGGLLLRHGGCFGVL